MQAIPRCFAATQELHTIISSFYCYPNLSQLMLYHKASQNKISFPAWIRLAVISCGWFNWHRKMCVKHYYVHAVVVVVSCTRFTSLQQRNTKRNCSNRHAQTSDTNLYGFLNKCHVDVRWVTPHSTVHVG